MARHAKSRRVSRLSPKHVRRRRAHTWLHAVVGCVTNPSGAMTLLALVATVAVLAFLPGADAGIGGKQEQLAAVGAPAPPDRPRPRKPKPARTTTTTTRQATTTSVQPTATTAAPAGVGDGSAGLLSKPGPSPDIRCPAAAVDILAGQDIQAKINASANGTTFCLRAGRHTPSTAYLDPSPGDVFIGEYGAIVDGQHRRAVSFSVRYGSRPVTVKNLIIEHFTSHGIEGASGWTIENNEVRYNGGDGIWLGSVNRSNYVHHNNHGGMASGFGQSGVVVENNEIAFNNTDSIRDEPDAGGKMVALQGVDYHHNWVHDNYANGIYCDINCYGLDIHHNLVERNTKVGIELEISYDSQIHDNVLRGNGIVDSRCAEGIRCWFSDLGGILAFNSSDVRIYRNTIEDANGHGIVGRQDDRRSCDTGDPNTGRFCRGDHVVRNLQVYGNKVKAPSDSRMYQFADGRWSPFVLAGVVGPNELFGGAYNNRFYSNSYQVPSSAGLRTNWFKWIGDTAITWSGWQSAGQDGDGGISTY
jgi:Right handed beta helix region